MEQNTASKTVSDVETMRNERKTAEKRFDTFLRRSSRRAVEENIIITFVRNEAGEVRDDLVRVQNVKDNGEVSEYGIDLSDGMDTPKCTCPAFEHFGAPDGRQTCKHVLNFKQMRISEDLVNAVLKSRGIKNEMTA